MSKTSEQGEQNNRRRSLKDADWNLDTLLELHYGFLHRSTKQQMRALDALLHIVDRNPEPMTVSALDLLKDIISPLAYGSAGADLLFLSLAQRNTPAADEAMKQILRDSGKARNEDFRRFLEIVITEGKPELLNVLDDLQLSQTKSKLLRQALDKNENDDQKATSHTSTRERS